jgi:predicted tellurium resistance membrane protein TerC
MNKFNNDTTAAIATAISGSSALITFTQTYQPIVTFCVGILGIISGVLAVVYYHKKIKSIDGKGN